MVLILSSDNDQKTNGVISWLMHYNVPFVRINGNTKIDILSFGINDVSDEVSFVMLLTYSNGESIKVKSEDIDSYWYRRGKLNINYPYISKGDFENAEKNYVNVLNRYLQKEGNQLTESIYRFLGQKKNINDYLKSDANKIDNLVVAKSVGLGIPKTIIANSRNELLAFLELHPAIVKPIYVGGLSIDDFHIGAPTNVITKEILEQSDYINFPCCAQELLDKAYELRIFYLNGECFASAIFSQNDPQTSVDFRRYNKTRRNRTPPFKLPASIHNSIRKLMNKIDMNCGSIDIVVTKEKEYVFLEVNPIGQFSQVSYPCNYFLEKRIAEYFKYE